VRRGDLVHFDEPAQRHVQVAEMVIEKASGSSSTRRTRDPARLDHAPGARLQPSSRRQGAVGRVDSNALTAPEALLRRGRNIEKAARSRSSRPRSSTTGSRMDEVIFGVQRHRQSEIHLDRKLTTGACSRQSTSPERTRKEELLLNKDDLTAVWVLRKVLTRCRRRGDGTAAVEDGEDEDERRFLARWRQKS